ncbi:hypothetical protein BGZ97_000558 [Linnemannia gamsii]|uniref:Lysosomal dipeptide transporter MFSD1 n=1 Tax=Linnemannia gamsii TaxID=64522 RepID=A0A9P6RLW6_9FUNG|nr:hypothetical protein BGZ97_000558 [Linnemannia gamsii]
MPYNDYQYLLSTLYSVYSLPNTVLPFLFGSFVDRFGPQRVLLGLSACVCIGQTIFSVGVQTRQIWMMLVGRAIFGVGGESCGVAQASITTMHFRGHELAFALGLNLCIARFGSVVNTLVTPWAEQKWDVPTAIWIGTLSCVASFLSAILLVVLIDTPSSSVIDSKERELDTTTTPLLSARFPRSSTFDQPENIPHCLPTSGTDETLSPSLVKSPSHPAILQHLPGILRREASFSESIRSVRFRPGYARSGTRPSLHIVTVQDESKQNPQLRQPQEKRHEESWWRQWLADLAFFPSTFWLICMLTVLLYGTVVPFNNIASDFLQSKWYHDNPRKAAAVMGIPDTLGAVLVPGFGLVVDKYGGRASTLIASAFTMVVVHTTLGFTSLSPIFAFSLLGVAYSMYGVALWPSIACVVTNELHLGKGYGISTSFLNISLTLVPPIVATIRVIGDSFIPVEMFFIGMGLCGIIVGFTLKSFDRRDGGALEEPEIQVDVPVIVPETVISSSTSTVASPALSQTRSRFGRQQKRPALSCLQTTGLGTGAGPASGPASGSGSLWTPKQWQNNSNEGPRRYGSFSSPSIASPRMDGEFDLEEGVDGEKQVAAAVEDYSVTQHPILYNPLRGSSGSFRISRTAKPVAFGEGEEGLIYLNGQEVELRYDDNGNHNNDGDGYQSGSEQDYEEDGDFECDNDVTVQGSEVGERNDLLSEHNSSSSNSRHHGNLDEFTMSDSTADTIAPDPMEEM